MGAASSCGISAEKIVNSGIKILSEYFTQGLFSQAVESFSAKRHCGPLRRDEDVEDHLRCNFLKGQRESFETILLLLAALIIVSLILSFCVYRKTRKVITIVRQSIVASPRLEAVTGHRETRTDTRIVVPRQDRDHQNSSQPIGATREWSDAAPSLPVEV